MSTEARLVLLVLWSVLVAVVVPARDATAGDFSAFRVDLARERIQPIQEGDETVWSYELVVTDEEILLADGTPYKVWAFDGQVPGPLLIAREGDKVRIKLVNETGTPHTIHSHGLHVPRRMDGVPMAYPAAGEGHEDMPWMHPVAPGDSFVYEFVARPAGTHFYHCHVNTNAHLDRGMSGPLIVLPREPEPRSDQDIVMLVDEWNSAYAQGGTPGRPGEEFAYDFFTINGKSFPETDTIQADLGDLIRIRFINVGAQPHSMHLHGHTFVVTHKDGARLREPLLMDTVPVFPGERVDIVVAANNPGSWPLHCHTVAHVTNNGNYPGGMLTKLNVGAEMIPAMGDGPIGQGADEVRALWASQEFGGGLVESGD